MTTLHPVILCGGTGTRLWPSSRKAFPKQFAPLLGEESLFQSTLARFSAGGFAAPLIMTGEDFRFLAVEQAEEIGLRDARVVIEPLGRDTGPAILAAALMLEDTPDDLMLVAPSDHAITDVEAFHAALRAARPVAEDGALVTFGVMPDRPETGYGYLQLAGRLDGPTTVAKFTEKPDFKTAEAMLEAGHYLWNAGMFMGRVRDFVAAFEKHAPDLIAPVREAVSKATHDLSFTRLDEKAFAAARAISIDYAIMERGDWVVAVLLDCGWSDLGAWDGLWAVSEQDAAGNALSGDAQAFDCQGSYLRSEEANMTLVGVA